MSAVVERMSSPLGRVRAAATLFSMIAGGSCLPGIDTQLPALRVTLAYLAVTAIIANAVIVFARDQVQWWSVLISGPLVTLSYLGLRDKPSTIALALSLIAGQTLYGTTRMVVVRIGVFAAIVPALVVATPASGGTPQPLSAAVVPVIVIALFSVLLRLLYSALHVHQVAEKREALLAVTSRALLESFDTAQAESIVRSTLEQLTRDIAGVHIVPSSATSSPSPHALTLAFQTTGEELTVDGPAVTQVETQRFMESLTAQLSLVRANHAAHRELYTMAHHDLLTSLSNRRAFFAALTASLDTNPAPQSVGVMLIDLDDFKAVNDTHGHAAGDAVLVEVARRMLEAAGEQATAARFGGDEFAVLTHVTGPEELEALAQQVSRSIRCPIPWGRSTLLIGASIGIANALAGQSPGDLMHVADLAMYEAKSLGKNQVAQPQPYPVDHDVATYS